MEVLRLEYSRSIFWNKERGTRRGGHGEGADLLSTRGFAVIFHSKVPHEMIS